MFGFLGYPNEIVNAQDQRARNALHESKMELIQAIERTRTTEERTKAKQKSRGLGL